MNIGTRNIDGVTILDLSGHIDLSNSSALRKTMLASVMCSDNLAVNMAAVKYIGSSGIASLLEALKQCRASRKNFVLFGLADAVKEVLQLTRLTGIFEICENEQDAIGYCMPARTRGSTLQ